MVQTFSDAWDALSARLSAGELYFGHGASDADTEALWILSSCINLAPSVALEELEQTYPPIAYQKALAITQTRLATRQPLAYILGEAYLMGYHFICDARSIVPRSLIAELITDHTLNPWIPAGAKALDLCTGNGSLAILLALTYPDIGVCAADISPAALELAKLNVEKYQLQDVVPLYCGDLFNALPASFTGTLLDLIVCNPPYVNASSMRMLPTEYLKEPELALAGGINGMDLIEQILAQAKFFLKTEGALVLEIGNEYANFSQLYPKLVVTWLDVSAGSDQVCLIMAKDLP